MSDFMSEYRRNRFILKQETKDKFKPIVSDFINRAKEYTEKEVEKMKELPNLCLSDTELNPHTLQILLEEEFGYDRDDSEQNGWKMDFWISMLNSDNKCPAGLECLTISGCGITFELNLCIEDKQPN